MLWKVVTPGGHKLPEVVSALQKCIRRGQTDDAIYWGVQMYLAGYQEYAWKRLRIMASEDVGLADRTLPATLQALYQAFQDQAKKKDTVHAPERLFFVHAILLLATAPKNRSVDHALIVHFHCHTALHRPIPDYALDLHTQKGKQLGRGVDHFFDEGSKLACESGGDAYREAARQAMKKGRQADEPAKAAHPAELFD